MTPEFPIDAESFRRLSEVYEYVDIFDNIIETLDDIFDEIVGLYNDIEQLTLYRQQLQNNGYSNAELEEIDTIIDKDIQILKTLLGNANTLSSNIPSF